ncbi:MAG: 50S ribosomal protein L13 [Planctomycetota bacterium]|nr:MAG: 50S ribosomal protein L13 [Planctomycetota bacterium]
MKSYMARKESVERKWWVVDATDHILGRMATEIAMRLMGKHKPIYTPHVDTGDYVVVVNAGKVAISGKKAETKKYKRYTGYPGGLKLIPYARMLEKKPEEIIRLAVRRMLPKSKLGRAMIKKLKIYAGPNHPHDGQSPEPLTIQTRKSK